ncbi:hypothetical protein [Mycobacterium sp. Lab-001]
MPNRLIASTRVLSQCLSDSRVGEGSPVGWALYTPSSHIVLSTT